MSGRSRQSVCVKWLFTSGHLQERTRGRPERPTFATFPFFPVWIIVKQSSIRHRNGVKHGKDVIYNSVMDSVSLYRRKKIILDSLKPLSSICSLNVMGCFFLIGLTRGAGIYPSSYWERGRNTLRTHKPFKHMHKHPFTFTDIRHYSAPYPIPNLALSNLIQCLKCPQTHANTPYLDLNK